MNLPPLPALPHSRDSIRMGDAEILAYAEALAAARETFDRIRQLTWTERQTNVAQRLAIQAIARIDAAIAKGERHEPR